MADTERRTRPTLWMLILVLLGIYTIPKVSTTGPTLAPSKSEGKAEEPDHPSRPGAEDRGSDEKSIRQLLLDHFTLGEHAKAGEIRTLEKLLGEGVNPVQPLPEIRCLIATLADPIRSTSAYN